MPRINVSATAHDMPAAPPAMQTQPQAPQPPACPGQAPATTQQTASATTWQAQATATCARAWLQNPPTGRKALVTPTCSPLQAASKGAAPATPTSASIPTTTQTQAS